MSSDVLCDTLSSLLLFPGVLGAVPYPPSSPSLGSRSLLQPLVHPGRRRGPCLDFQFLDVIACPLLRLLFCPHFEALTSPAALWMLSHAPSQSPSPVLPLRSCGLPAPPAPSVGAMSARAFPSPLPQLRSRCDPGPGSPPSALPTAVRAKLFSD